MIDLTPLDVRKKRGDFRKILRGYDPEEVDTFLELVAERLEGLVRENLTLSERSLRFEGQLRALEQREKAVQEALVTAQKLREDVQAQSQREAESLRSQAVRDVELHRAEAEQDIARRLQEAEGILKEQQRALEEVERSRRKFLKAFRSLLEREMDAVEVEEARRPLEDAPLELDLRGWALSGAAPPQGEEIESEPEPENPEATETVEADPSDEIHEAGTALVERTGDLVAPVESASEVEETRPEGPGVNALEAEELETEEPEPEILGVGAADGDEEPGGFDTQIFELHRHRNAEAQEVQELEEVQEAQDPTDTPQHDASASAAEKNSTGEMRREPRWLFSLLKDESKGEPADND